MQARLFRPIICFKVFGLGICWLGLHCGALVEESPVARTIEVPQAAPEQVFDSSGQFLGDLIYHNFGVIGVITPQDYWLYYTNAGELYPASNVYYESDDCTGDLLVLDFNDGGLGRPRAETVDGNLFVPQDVTDGLAEAEYNVTVQGSEIYTEDNPPCNSISQTFDVIRMRPSDRTEVGVPSTITGPLEIRSGL